MTATRTTPAPATQVRGVLTADERRALRRAVGLLDLDRVRLLWAVLAGSASLASGIALTATAAWLIARASQMPPVLELSVAAVAVRTFGISRALLRYLERLASHLVALRGMATLRERVYTTLAAGRADAVAGLRRGDLLARTGTDVDAVGDVVVRALLPAVVAAAVGAGSVVLVAWLNLGAGMVLAVCLLVAGVAGPWLNMRAARLAERAQIGARAEISATALTMVDGAAELTVSGRLRDVLASLRSTEHDLARAKDTAARPAALAAGLDTLAMGVAVLGSLALGIPATVAGSMEAVELAVIVLTPLAAFEGTAMLGPAAVQLVRSSGSAVRIMELLDRAGTDAEPAAVAAGPGPAAVAAGPGPTARAATTSVRTPPGTVRAEGPRPTPQGPRPTPQGPRPTPQGPRPTARGPRPTARGPRLTARGLAVGWPGGPVVAEGIDLDVAPGRAVAVVGRSGVGKTTLLLTLAGLLPPRAGTVELDGTAVWGADRRRVSSDVVLTAEDAHIFGTTVLENLRVARGDVTEAEATELLGRAGLGDWLASLPAGLSTVLGSDAATVSGGERRRLLLARALASRARLLLLDEPGEHLDPVTADRLLTDLLRVATDPSLTAPAAVSRGVVLVTHRLSPLAAAEEVIVLGEAGDGPATVLARGTHEHLRAELAAYRWALEQEEQRA